MASGGVIKRWIRAIFDSAAAKKTEQQLEDSLASAGRAGGASFMREVRAAFAKRTADLRVQLAKGLISPEEFKKQGDQAARAFNTSVIAGMEKARGAGSLTNTEYLKLAGTLKKVGDDGKSAGSIITSAFVKAGAAIAGFFALSKVEEFFASGVHAAIQEADSVAALDSALRPLGLTYAQVGKQAEAAFTKIQKTTRFGTDDARAALVNLVTATGDYTLALKLLDPTTKIAERRHITMAEAAQTAADASQGLTKGMKDLGISTGETGDIVAKINTNLGDNAVEAARKGSGAIAQLNNLWDNFKQKIGKAILDSDTFASSMGGIKTAVTDLNTWVDKNSGALTALFDALGSFAKHASNILLTSAKGWGLIFQQLGFGAKESAGAVGEAQGEMTGAAAAGAAKRRAISETEKATLLKITAEGGDELVNLTAKDLAEVHALRKAEAAGTITLTQQQSNAVDKILKAEVSQNAQRKKMAGERAENLTQEIADLRRLAAAYGIDAAAVAAAEQALRTDADIRSASKDLTKAQAAELAKLIRVRDQERQSIEALSRATDIRQELADLKRLASAQVEGARAVDLTSQALATEADIRQATKGLTKDQAADIASEIRLRNQQRQAIDAVNRVLDVKQQVADAERLLAVQGKEPRVVAATELALQREAQIREAVKGLTIDQAAALAALINRRNQLNDQQKGESEADALQRDTDIVLARTAAEQKGETALKAFDRELFIQEALMRAGAKAGSELEAQIRRLAGANFDAAHAAGTWRDALQGVVKQQTQGLGQAFASRNDDKRRVQEITRALKQENLTIKERISLEQELKDIQIPWIKKFAQVKIKENLAAALEEGAQALAFIAFHDFKSAAASAKSAAGHVAAAAAWGGVAAIAGGGGGAGGAGGGAEASGGGSTGVSGGASSTPLPQEIHIYLSGDFDALNPRVQKLVYGAMQNARERYGSNAHITIEKSKRP